MVKDHIIQVAVPPVTHASRMKILIKDAGYLVDKIRFNS